MKAHARRTDPHTSHEAAASVTGIRESQRDVYDVLAEFGPLHDERLVEIYAIAIDRGLVRKQSVSGIRSRRRELVDLGMARNTGEVVRTKTNRRSIVWAAT